MTPFGLANAPTTFMNAINNVFKSYLDKFIAGFIENILIYCKNKDEHTAHLRTLLQTLREHQLYDKLKKYEFWLEKVVFLGHVVLKEWINAGP